MDDYTGYWISSWGCGYAWINGEGYGDGVEGGEDGDGNGGGVKYVEGGGEEPVFMLSYQLYEYREG